MNRLPRNSQKISSRKKAEDQANVASDTRVTGTEASFCIRPAREKMELLAPAGTLAIFETAVDKGADAVYIGAPEFNARAVSHNFTMAEIEGMIAHAHSRKVKVYLAMNSLLKEEEIPRALETLALLSDLKADGLIVQDLGIYRLVKKYFPEIRLHASTLLGGHNSQAVKFLEQMGFSRVVLARELTLKEIARIRKQCEVELEVFVHGALCFSYSGLCLFSSFLGGKSGLRGRCVQPCRRRYAWLIPKTASLKKSRNPPGAFGRQSGYFFSMNDLSTINLLPDLQQAGVTSLKIEGRMRNAQYVGAAVSAYRMVLDALPKSTPVVQKAVKEAEELLGHAMSRKTTSGYFTSSQPAAVISPQHSGNIGLFLGCIKKSGRAHTIQLVVKQPVRVGDRLRLHQEKTGERFPFTLKEIQVAGKSVEQADKGESVVIRLPLSGRPGDSLYKVDTKTGRMLEKEQLTVKVARYTEKSRLTLIRSRVEKVLNQLQDDQELAKGGSGCKSPGLPMEKRAAGKNRARKKVLAGGEKKGSFPWPLKLWLKIDEPKQLKHLTIRPDQVLLVLDRENLGQYLKIQRHLKAYLSRIIWTLPPVIHENGLAFYRKAIDQLRRAGFQTWQIGHISQLGFFKTGRKATLVGDYTLNVLNTQSLLALQELGLRRAQVSIETDRDCLRMICEKKFGKGLQMDLGITVYGLPPLFTARFVGGHLRYDRPFVSPKGEELILKKCRDLTVALPRRIFSLLPWLPELAAFRLHYVVVDLSHMKVKEKDMKQLGLRLSGKIKGRNFSTFNYLGTLQ